MGGGGDARPLPADGLIRRARSGPSKTLAGVMDDLTVLKSIWLNKAQGEDHAARLEHFYGPQAHACTACAGAPLVSRRSFRRMRIARIGSRPRKGRVAFVEPLLRDC